MRRTSTLRTPGGLRLRLPSGLAAVIASLAASGSAVAQTPALDARRTTELLGGTLDASLVGRYEGLDDYSRITSGAGLSLRTRLRWDGPDTFGVRAVLGVDDLDARVHRAPVAERGGLVALPLRDRGASPQAALTWRDSKNSVTVGRQRLPLLGEGAVRASGWRPGEQTFDGLALKTRSLPRTELRYAYVTGVNAPAATDRPATRLRGAAHLVDGTVDAGPLGAFSGFAYELELPATGAVQNSTYGIDWRREIPAGPLGRLPIGVSFSSATARLLDGDAAFATGANPGTVGTDRTDTTATTARYVQLETGLGLPNTKLKVGRGTSTAGPRSLDLLSPLYARQGAIGRFGTTPLPGGVDAYALLQTEFRGATIEVGRHAFRAADAREDRDGWSTTVSRRVTPRLQVQARVADATRRGDATDDRSYWLQFGTSIP
jgi:hypothetical protein